jgi:hypothetical protein
MTLSRPAVLAVFVPCIALSQAPTGVAAQWDMRGSVDQLAKQTERLAPMLEQLRPKEWVAAGASETYVQQWESSRQQIVAAQTLLGRLAQDTERLTVAIDAYLRLETVATQVTSLAEGARRHQNPALADLIGGVLAESRTGIQQLRQHLVDLADLKEKEFKVMDEEAQRCRGTLTRRPVTSPALAPKAPAQKKVGTP